MLAVIIFQENQGGKGELEWDPRTKINGLVGVICGQRLLFVAGRHEFETVCFRILADYSIIIKNTGSHGINWLA